MWRKEACEFVECWFWCWNWKWGLNNLEFGILKSKFCQLNGNGSEGNWGSGSGDWILSQTEW